MIEFLRDCNGKPSMMRLLCLISVVGLIPAFYINPSESSAYASVMVVALAGKWLQKKGESK